MNTYPTMSMEKYISTNYPMEFVGYATSNMDLKENEYFALVVCEYNHPYSSPHIECIETTKHLSIVGVEKTSVDNSHG